jgi:hypothetical protein
MALLCRTCEEDFVALCFDFVDRGDAGSTAGVHAGKNSGADVKRSEFRSGVLCSGELPSECSRRSATGVPARNAALTARTLGLAGRDAALRRESTVFGVRVPSAESERSLAFPDALLDREAREDRYSGNMFANLSFIMDTVPGPTDPGSSVLPD